ncbi:hypothetical protein [Persephonella sp.]
MEYIYELIERIRRQQLEILDLEKQLADLKKEQAEIQKLKRDIELEVQKEVAFDKELKNDKQRQAKAKELLDSNDRYLSLLEQEKKIEEGVSNAIYEIKRMNIELDYLKRLYDIQLIHETKKQEALS